MARTYKQFMYSLHNFPVMLTASFVVDSANGNGLGIRSLKAAGINNIFMHTSATPGANNGFTNPNPAAGNIVVQFADGYTAYLGGYSGFVSPVSGTPILVTAAGAHLTVGTAYIIVTLGTTTAADWVTMGLPVGIPAAVGVAFIAAATGAGVGSGAVEIASKSGIRSIEAVGDANLSIGLNVGSSSQAIFQCLNDSNALAAPVDGSVCGMTFMLSLSSATMQPSNTPL